MRLSMDNIILKKNLLDIETMNPLSLKIEDIVSLPVDFLSKELPLKVTDPVLKK